MEPVATIATEIIGNDLQDGDHQFLAGAGVSTEPMTERLAGSLMSTTCTPRADRGANIDNIQTNSYWIGWIAHVDNLQSVEVSNIGNTIQYFQVMGETPGRAQSSRCLGSGFGFREIDTMGVLSRSSATTIFELLAATDGDSESLSLFTKMYEQGLTFYKQKD